MDTTSVAYVLCRIEDDSSLTPVSQHEDFLTGIAAGSYESRLRTSTSLTPSTLAIPQRVVHAVASFREGRIGYREWATRSGRYPQLRGSLRPRR